MMLKVAFSLLIVSLLGEGVHGQCTTPPINQAVYEGTQNTMMNCNGATPVSWTVTPTDNEQFPSKITNLSDTVAPTLTNLYAVTHTNLNIKVDQSSPTVPPITTSGLYVAQNSAGTRVGAKLVVVRAPPTCNCTAINSTYKQISCSVTYADYTYNPICAKIIWTADGNFVKNDTQCQRTRVNGVFTSTSTITTIVNDSATYQCKLTFTTPQNISLTYIATNAPVFSAICTPNCVYGQCSTPPVNQAVYEGTQNTKMACNSLTKVSWTVTPTDNELFPAKITNNSDTVVSPYTSLYDVTQTNLNIKAAQSSNTTPPIATSGMYIAQISGSNNRIGAKLVVVRQGPRCNCTAINSTSNNISCSVTYADGSSNPIYAKVTWTADGNFLKNETLNQRTRVNGSFTATSTITISVNDPATYQCKLTFTKPQSISVPYIATIAPEFSASCTSP